MAQAIVDPDRCHHGKHHVRSGKSAQECAGQYVRIGVVTYEEGEAT
jgi:hypothetical protein